MNKLLCHLSKKQRNWLQKRIDSLLISEANKELVLYKSIKIFNSVATIKQAFLYAFREVLSDYCLVKGQNILSFYNKK